MFCLCLLLANKPLTTGANVNPFKCVVVCVFVAICGCDQGQPTPPVASYPIPVATFDPTPVKDMELPESADSIGMEFKLIPAGTFTMGEGKEAHKVTLTKPFKMGVHEVTQDQYEQVMGVNPSDFNGACNPVEMVTWEDAVEFCRKLSELPAEKAAGRVYRLPTEAEWEYACRAGTTTNYSFGNNATDLGLYAWYAVNSGGRTHPVGGKRPNSWGLYDMHGNVWEWCQDRFAPHPSGFLTDPTGPEVGSHRVIRGGSYLLSGEFSRSGFRRKLTGVIGLDDYGFRVSLSPSGK